MDELDALWAFLVAAVVAFAVTPPTARLATRLGVLHYPRERDLHERPVPGLGGLAIPAAAVVAALIFLPAGVCTIAAGTFAIFALSFDGADRTAAGILAALTAGAAVGFLWHNFHPASIFMGDAGSNLLGLLLACVAIQGVLKTAAVVALFFPLLILAVPALDATFVVAKRIKYGRPVYSADRWHFHHRFANIGFSQRRTVLYLYGWTLSLAALALAMRFVPYSEDDGTLNVGWAAVIGAFALVAFAASVYLVIVLEILKFRRFRERELRRQVETGEIPALSDSEIEHEIEREVETGEFEAVRPPQTGEVEAAGRE